MAMDYLCGPANVRLRKIITKRAGVCLRNLQKQGAASSHQGAGQFMLWKLITA
jgi:hypothetical protein